MKTKTGLTLALLLSSALLPPSGSAQSGWLLLDPPFDGARIQELELELQIPERASKALERALLGWTLNTEAPLLSWDQVGAYDSAVECETARKGLEAKALELVAKWEKEPPKAALMARSILAKTMAARCLPASALSAPSR